MADDKMRIRIGKDGRLLLLACAAGKGKLALGKTPCAFDNWHIAIKTDDFQHPSCIDFTLSQNRQHSLYSNTDTSKYSQCYVVGPGTGKFVVQLRWESGHSPYPEIENMEVWVFGVYLGNKSYPKAYDDYTNVATVEVRDTGQVLVNGKNAGFWPEMLRY